MSFNPYYDEDRDYDFNARYDYLSEAYGTEARLLDEQNANERQCFACGEYISKPDVTCEKAECKAEYEDYLAGEQEAEGERRAYEAERQSYGSLSAAAVDYAQNGECPF
jgi:hypothetical protein